MLPALPPHGHLWVAASGGSCLLWVWRWCCPRPGEHPQRAQGTGGRAGTGGCQGVCHSPPCLDRSPSSESTRKGWNSSRASLNKQSTGKSKLPSTNPIKIDFHVTRSFPPGALQRSRGQDSLGDTEGELWGPTLPGLPAPGCSPVLWWAGQGDPPLPLGSAPLHPAGEA